jgi:hypothetical protein
VTAKLLESQNILVERNCFLQILYPVPRVQQFLDHGLLYSRSMRIQTHMHALAVLLPSEAEGSRSLISGCSAGFLDYGFAPLEMTKIQL